VIFIGHFSDWRTGLETYAKANALIAPERTWNKAVPFGWNSWGKIQGKLTYEKAIQVSDFFAENLQPNNFQNDSIVYIGLDSYWDRLNDNQLKLFVEHCRANHQEAGIYWAPFTEWWRPDRIGLNNNETYEVKELWRGQTLKTSGLLSISLGAADVVEQRAGSSPDYSSIKMPGQTRYSNIVLKREITKGDNEFFNWISTIKLNTVERRDISIALLNEVHEPVMVWKVKNAFPIKLTGPVLDASASEIAIETLELAHEGLSIIND